MKYDVIILGAGPAGISASLYVKRAGFNVLVLYHGESQLEKAHKIQNFYGFADGISGKDLYETGINQAKNLGIEVLDQEVTHIELLSAGKLNEYSVKTSGGEYSASSIIICTGNKKLKPQIKGIEEFEGKGISYCAVCDGFFYRKKKVCVIGDKRYALEEALHLANMAESVTILTNGNNSDEIKALLESEKSRLEPAVYGKLKLDDRAIKEISGQEKVSSVLFSDQTSVAADGVFVALGEAGGADFAKKLGLNLSGDNILVDEKMQTNAKGIFSAGNVTGGLLQVSKAVYEGSVAGLSAVEYLRG
ncbi:MAG: FAD-dependent oxidoreductase [Treponema sp.]|nr:FAD-dependent oxidoreductase [Treponema sp.]